MITQQKRTKFRTPLSRHRLFPALIALWFASLFSLGELAVRPALLDALVSGIGLDRFIVTPLGLSGRLLIALGLFGAGAGFGQAVARTIPGSRAAAMLRAAKAQTVMTGAAVDEAVLVAPRKPVAQSSMLTPHILDIVDLDPVDDRASPFAPAVPAPVSAAADLERETSRTAPCGSLGVTALAERLSLAVTQCVEAPETQEPDQPVTASPSNVCGLERFARPSSAEPWDGDAEHLLRDALANLRQVAGMA